MSLKKMNLATYQKAKVGNDNCGDSYFYVETEREFICIIVDGLGSGKIARESSQAVIDVIKADVHITDEMFIKKSTRRLVGKRGVVLGLLRINFMNEKYTYSSIGNIGLLVTMSNNRRERIIPRPGYLGNSERQLKVVQGKLKKDMGFFMYSDGVSDQDLSKLCLINGKVKDIIQGYAHIIDGVRNDDTTLIAMRYMGVDDEADS